MTVNEAIAGAVEVLGDAVTREALVTWLWEIENVVVREIGMTHEGYESDHTMDRDCDGETILFAPDPYSQLYVHYLLMKGDLSLRDTTQYVNSATQFSVSYNNFSDWYNRTYMPLQTSDIKL